MTTADFIEKTYGTTSDKDRQCSSVFTDRSGTVYSYGYHYPLAFHVKGLDFINEAGYSSTTSKHIAWARRALDYGYIRVKLWRNEAQVIAASYADEEDKLKAILAALNRELAQVRGIMATKTRKDTFVYRELMAIETRVTDAINNVKEVI